MSPREQEKFEAQMFKARSALGEDVLASAFDEVRKLSWEQAAAYSQDE